jgi:hypothetical protein
MGKMRTEEKVAAWIAGVWLLFGIAWVAFLVWLLVTVVSWLVTK